jgi:hypothetical protein
MMADMQRARLIAGELPKFGWEAEILTPEASFQTDFSRLQGEGLAFPEVPVYEAEPWHPSFFRRMGSRNIGIRAAVPVGRTGLELLRTKRFDLVHFSTTQHWITCNGARWRRRTGVPYVADLHDPVYLEKKVYFVSRHRIKERIAKHLGKTIERLALGRADGLVSVSPGYVNDVARRHPWAPWVQADRYLVQPFPADLRALDAVETRHEFCDPSVLDVIYVGAGGSIMQKGWRELLGSLSEQSLPQRLRIRLIGTDTNWAENRKRPLQDMAQSFGLGNVVAEESARISYTESMALTQQADGLLVLGVDDANYRPSKLQTCIASGRPLLVLVHANSTMIQMLDQAGPGVQVVRFGGAEGDDDRNRAAVRNFLVDLSRKRRWTSAERSFLSPQDAAAGHAELFNRIVESR